MKSLILSILSIFSVAGSLIAPVERELWSQPEPIKFEVEGRPAAYQPRVEACNKAVETFTDQYTDHWYKAMESCVYLDADYLNEISPTISPETDRLSVMSSSSARYARPKSGLLQFPQLGDIQC